MSPEAPIGIFDSGVGGLTVFAAIRRRLPHETLVYLGDTARVPYGTKSDETVVRYSLENAAFLASHGVKAIVVACNSASALALSAIAEHVDVPVLGVVWPGARAALANGRGRRIGVLGTPATVASDAYGRALKSLDASVDVVSVACPLFVPLVEEGWLAGDIPLAIAHRYLGELRDDGIDTLILGCTHYPLLESVIGEVMGPRVALIDSGDATAAELDGLLAARDLHGCAQRRAQDRLYVTDVPAKFREVAGRFLGGDLPAVSRISL